MGEEIQAGGDWMPDTDSSKTVRTDPAERTFRFTRNTTVSPAAMFVQSTNNTRFRGELIVASVSSAPVAV